MAARFRRAALLLMATMALVTFGVSITQAQWPTTCVELNDLAEAAVGNHQKVGIYQQTYGGQAEAQCQNDHRDDVRRTFAWALGGAGEAVAGTWPTSCVALNDLAEAARGSPGNVGIYQQAFTREAEAERACRADHRADVIATFAWAIPAPVPDPTPDPTPDPVPEATPTSQATPPTEHPDYQRVRSTAFARSGDADLADAVASDVIARGTVDSFLRGTNAGVQFGHWNCPSRNAACPLAPEVDQDAQSQAPPTRLITTVTDDGRGYVITQVENLETGLTVRLHDLVPRGHVASWDGAQIDLSNLDADQTYEVVVSSSNPSVVGIRNCLGPSEWTTFTGLTSRSLRFSVRSCALGTATVTVEVRLAGATSAAASLSQQRSTEPIPSVPEFQRPLVEQDKREVRDLLARGGPERPVQRPYPPSLFGYVGSASKTATTVSWATWWATPPTGDVQITGYQLQYWPQSDRSKVTTLEFTDPNTWQHRLSGLTADSWYRVQLRACTNHQDCSETEWSHAHGFKARPLERGPDSTTPIPSS